MAHYQKQSELEKQSRSEERQRRQPVLHIGGPLHGQRRIFPLDSPFWNIGWYYPVTAGHPLDELHGERPSFEVRHYRPERLMFGNDIRIIFVVDGMPTVEAFDRMIADLKR